MSINTRIAGINNWLHANDGTLKKLSTLLKIGYVRIIATPRKRVPITELLLNPKLLVVTCKQSETLYPLHSINAHSTPKGQFK